MPRAIIFIPDTLLLESLAAIAAVSKSGMLDGEDAARLLKAQRIATILIGYGCTYEDVWNLYNDPGSRTSVEAAALGTYGRGVPKTASKKTWTLVAVMVHVDEIDGGAIAAADFGRTAHALSKAESTPS